MPVHSGAKISREVTLALADLTKELRVVNDHRKEKINDTETDI